MTEDETNYGSQEQQPQPDANAANDGNENASAQPAQQAEPAPEPDPDYPGRYPEKEYTISSRTTGKVIQQMDRKCQQLGITRRQFIESAVKYAIEEPFGDISFG